jgi:ribosomal protein S18 acetylase RimI-like enzyme
MGNETDGRPSGVPIDLSAQQFAEKAIEAVTDDTANRGAPPFGKARYSLTVEDCRQFPLEPPGDVSAQALGHALSRIDPWLTLGVSSNTLSTFLLREDPHCFRKVIRCDNAIAGVVAVRSPWLYGPYLNLLAVLPPYQHIGVGSAVLHWMASEAGASASNLWVCVSKFNPRAFSFYERHGYQLVAELPELVKPGFAELLLRKQLRRAT